MKQHITAILLCIFCTIGAANGQERNASIEKMESMGLEYELKAGINIGGYSPLPLPNEIRSIDSYNPRFNSVLEGVVTYWMGDAKQWGISAGIKLENKGMKTDANVKNYNMEIIDEGSRVSGNWTGDVQTTCNGLFATLPLMANYRMDGRWKMRAGLFFSYLLDGEFGGHVSNGYLREGTPIGEKIEFKDGKTAEYNFDDNLAKFLWGLQAGASWKAFDHFSLSGDLTWGVNNIFESSFKTITFDMYAIYLNVGFGYLF